MEELWTEEDESLLMEFKKEILIKPVMDRPDLNKRFYLKTDFSKFAFGAALCQADDKDEHLAEQEDQ